jgi:DNA polymerase III subunit epsilon
MYLFKDTETTGLYHYGTPSNDPKQPYIVELALLLTDIEGDTIKSFSTLIKPEGWVIPQEATNVHGITTEECEEKGIPFEEAYQVYLSFREECKLIIGHNISYDSKMIRRVAGKERYDSLPVKEKYCTMQKSTPICKISGKRGYKWPKLEEAYRIICGKEIEGAHRAMADVEATKELFFKPQEGKQRELF